MASPAATGGGRQNRVWPTGEIVADAARGLFMGNRGVLHRHDGTLGAARWRHRAWVVCHLEFRGRRRQVMAPGRYTELFFLDEAVALAAGHRPCGECRRGALAAFREAWRSASGDAPALADLDRALHAARVRPGSREQQRHRAPLASLPDGAFVRIAGQVAPCLVLGARLLPFAPTGYGAPLPRPPLADAEVLTPRPTVAALAAGFRPALHPSARAGGNPPAPLPV